MVTTKKKINGAKRKKGERETEQERGGFTSNIEKQI